MREIVLIGKVAVGMPRFFSLKKSRLFLDPIMKPGLLLKIDDHSMIILFHF